MLLLQAEVQQLERHKRGVDPRDRRFAVLSSAVRSAAQTLLDFTAREEAWAAGATAAAGPLATIEESATEPSLTEILERWRAVERELEQADPEGDAAKRLFVEFERLREEYLAAFRTRAQRRD